MATAATDARPQLAPLAGQLAQVRGDSTAARIIADHLGRLGAAAWRPGATAAGDLAAGAVLEGPLGRAELGVAWADAVPGVYDETSAQAVCGIMHVHGRRSGRPRGLSLDVAGSAAGVLAVTGLLAQLTGARRGVVPAPDRTGVDRAALVLASHYLAVASADSDQPPTGPGGPPFQAADGVWFELEALHAEGWARFWTELDAPQPAIRDGWRSFQLRFSVAAAPLPDPLHRAASSRPWRQVRRIAEQAGVSACAIVGVAERRNELGLHRGAALGDPWWLRPGPPVLTTGPAAPAGADAPLAGLVVLEAGRRIQGPLAAHLLRLLGAEVVRIEPPGGDPMRGMPPTRGEHSAVWTALNWGKSAVEIDIKSSDGRRDLLDLARRADVFLHNWAAGKAADLRLDAAALHAANPGLVYAHTSGWSGALAQPPLATDFMVQARSGVADALRAGGEPPRPTLMTVLDSLGGMLGAEAVLAGLLHREATGRGSSVESSLLAAGTMLAGPALVAGRWSAPARDPWRTSDGWIVAEAGAPPSARTSTRDALDRYANEGVRAAAVTTTLLADAPDHSLAGVLQTGPAGCALPPYPWSTSPTPTSTGAGSAAAKGQLA